MGLEARLDKSGKKAAETFQEWMESCNPSLKGDRIGREKAIRGHLDQLYRLGPLAVVPVRSSVFQSRRYAEELARRAG